MSCGTEERSSKKTKLTRKDVNIVNEGERIILPVGMAYSEGIEWLRRKDAELETTVAINEEVNCFPLDGAYAFAQVLKNRYGWTNLVPTPGFFGSNPPLQISVEVGYKETVTVSWGRCKIPGIDGYVETGFKKKNGMPIFVLEGEVKRRHENTIHEIGDEIRKYVLENSIYRAKAIKINFRNTQDQRRENFEPDFAPKFINVEDVRAEELIFPDKTAEMVRTTLFNPIEFSPVCRANGVPLKRGILLEGPYGTGKTLTAYVTGRKCVDNDWTFLYLEDVRDLDLALAFARFYQPVVIFAEDVDRAVGPNRDSSVDKILNSLDGVESKNNEIMVVLTTNDISRINQAFIRPGRIDAVINVQPPDTKATVRLVRQYGRNSIDKAVTDTDLEKAVEPMVGANAAFIRETVERARLAAVSHASPGPEYNISITAADIAVAAQGMVAHFALLKPKGDTRSTMEVVGELLIDEMAGGLQKRMATVTAQSNGVKENRR